MKNRLLLIPHSAFRIRRGGILSVALSRPPPTPTRIITLDQRPLPADVASKVHEHYVGDILDSQLLQRMVAGYAVEQVFHLAALLSTRGEFSPMFAHKVNVEGTLNLLEFAQIQ